jgi:hypothetical protein
MAAVDPSKRSAHLPAFAVVPTSRTYVHEKGCGGITAVSGWAFEAICHPLMDPTNKTLCAACQRYAPIFEFAWADTREGLVSYHKRLRPLLPAWAEFIFPARAIVLFGLPLAGYFVGKQSAGNAGGEIAVMVCVGLGVVAGIALQFAIPRIPKVDFRRYI